MSPQLDSGIHLYRVRTIVTIILRLKFGYDFENQTWNQPILTSICLIQNQVLPVYVGEWAPKQLNHICWVFGWIYIGFSPVFSQSTGIWCLRKWTNIHVWLSEIRDINQQPTMSKPCEHQPAGGHRLKKKTCQKLKHYKTGKTMQTKLRTKTLPWDWCPFAVIESADSRNRRRQFHLMFIR